MIERVLPVECGRWLMAAVKKRRGLPNEPGGGPEFVQPLNDGLELLAWRADGERLALAVDAVAGLVRRGCGAMITVGVAHPFRGVLLGWTAARLESKARRRRRWSRRPHLSRRLQGALCDLVGHPGALEILARSAPFDAARWLLWGQAMQRSGHPAAATVLTRGAVLAGKAIPPLKLLDIGRVAFASPRTELGARALGTLHRISRHRGEARTSLRLAGLRVGCLGRLGAWQDAVVVARALAPTPRQHGMLDAASTPLHAIGVDGTHPREEGDLLAAWAAVCRQGGEHGEATRHHRHRLELAVLHGDADARDAARLDLAWSALHAGDADMAEAWAETILEEHAHAEASLVAAEASLVVGDLSRVDSLLSAAERAEPAIPAWRTVSLRARLERGSEPRAPLLRTVREAIAARGGRSAGAGAGEDWVDGRWPLELLAAELSAEEGDAWGTVTYAEADAWRRLRLPGQPDVAAAEAVRAAADLHVLVLACGDRDVAGVHLTAEGAGLAHLPGAAAGVRSLCVEIRGALLARGPVLPLLTMLGERLRDVLIPAARGGRPLLVAAQGILAAVPWDLVPVQGRDLGMLRPTAQTLAFSLLTPIPAGIRGIRLQGPRTVDGLPEHAVALRSASRVALRGRSGWTVLSVRGGPRYLDLMDGVVHARGLRPGDVGATVMILAPTWDADERGDDEVGPALLAAGAAAVVVPIGPVDVRAVRPFLADLTGALAAGLPVTRAFQLARAATRADLHAGRPAPAAAYRLLLRGV